MKNIKLISLSIMLLFSKFCLSMDNASIDASTSASLISSEASSPAKEIDIESQDEIQKKGCCEKITDSMDSLRGCLKRNKKEIALAALAGSQLVVHNTNPNPELDMTATLLLGKALPELDQVKKIDKVKLAFISLGLAFAFMALDDYLLKPFTGLSTNGSFVMMASFFTSLYLMATK